MQKLKFSTCKQWPTKIFAFIFDGIENDEVSADLVMSSSQRFTVPLEIHHPLPEDLIFLMDLITDN